MNAEANNQRDDWVRDDAIWVTLEMLVKDVSSGEAGETHGDFHPVVEDCLSVATGPEHALRFSRTQAAPVRVVDQVGGALAHDFNNLLGVIIGNLVLADRLLRNAPEVKELIAEATDAASRGVVLARNLLAVSRGQHIGPTKLDLNTILARMQRLIHRIVGEDIKIDVQFGGDLWPVVAESSQFESSLLNLAANARDAMAGRGELVIRTENCRIDSDFGHAHPSVRAGDYVKISVEDNGCGMDPETLSQAFKPFFTTKEDAGGTGLGLSMVLDFVDRAGGHISTFSALDSGTVICLLLPRATEAAYVRGASAVITPPLPTNGHLSPDGEHGCPRTSAKQ